MLVVPPVTEPIALSFGTFNTKTQQSDSQIILQLARSNGGNVSLVDCLFDTEKPYAEVMNTLASLWDDGLLKIGNHQDGEIIYRLV